ncbi:MAG: hypothetical protein EOP18_02085 [Rhizobiaceae bacterium]|nr:MAG: hypothetical protein EOP18_02085 [Rhizobiaceae bacterium]
MDGHPRTPPRFVPTLTEIVDGSDFVPAESGVPAANAASTTTWITPQMQDALVERVMQRVVQRLEPKLSDTIAAIARQHSEAMSQHLSEKIEDVVSELVADAVNAELVSGRGL